MADNTSHRMIRPSKVFRIILWSVLTWFTLALLWAFLPAPTSEHDGDNGTDYATAVLRAGKTLTRIYERDEFHVDANTRWSFALDYAFDPYTNSLSISGVKKPLPLNVLDANAAEEITATARIGDSDGANLPWFEHADAVLLFWWIDRTIISIPLTIARATDAEHGLSTFDIQITDRTGDPLLSIQVPSNSTSSITATVPAKPHSSSPSSTYPIRVILIHIIAPTALLAVGICMLISFTLKNLFKLAFYGFFVFGVIVAFWKCVGGPSVETMVERAQERVDRWKENERLRFLPLDAVQRRLDRLHQRPTHSTPEDGGESGTK